MIFLIFEFTGSNMIDNGLLFFYASWSSNCNIQLDALKKIEKDNPDLQILKINTTKYRISKDKYQIHKIPTFIIIIDNKIISRMDGYKDRISLSNWVKKYRS